MKYITFILLLVLLTACTDSPPKNQKEKEEYTCPMHPDILKDEPGQCPICGMDLVKKVKEEISNVYTCPMHPEIIRDQPGACPICGMDLVEKQTEGGSLQDTAVQFQLKPSNQFVLSKTKTVRVQKQENARSVHASGIIAYDTRLGNSVSSRVAGRIEKLYVKYRFQPVNKGDKLMEIYSKDLVTEQQNYIYLLNNDAGNAAILSAAESKLELLGFTGEQIQNLKNFKKVQHALVVYSPYSGHLHDQQPVQANEGMNGILMTPQQLNLQEGMYVQKGQTLFTIYDTDKVWAVINLSSEKQSLLEKDLPVKIIVDGVKDTIAARIDFVEPGLRQDQKSITARVYLDNTDGRLKIGAILKAQIQVPIASGFYLPVTAVLNLGVRNVVFVLREKLFEAKEVKTGMKNNGWIQILSGLESSEAVAENAQMLVDSEAFVKTGSE